MWCPLIYPTLPVEMTTWCRLLSGVLQLLVLPWAMVRVRPSLLLTALPLVAGLGFTVTLAFPGFRTATAAFAVTKILEYSVRCAQIRM